MTIIKHELKQNRISLTVWTVTIGFLLAICIFLFPEMKSEMNEVSDIFASMGSFTEAFGMDKISFGTLTGFYAIECGNILGLGGAFFAAICSISSLSKEEKDHTAEFLLTHPVSRVSVITEKLISVMLEILVMNIFVFIISVLSIIAVGENIPWKEILLLHLAYFILQAEISGICFGISAFLHSGSIGIGLGIAAVMYFINIIANLTDSAKFLKYITPFGYAEGSDIVSNLSLDGKLVAVGIIFCLAGIIMGYIKYYKKDIL